jgi:hypothetical protein
VLASLAQTISDHLDEIVVEEESHRTLSKNDSPAVENEDTVVSTAITTSIVNNLDSYKATLAELEESVLEEIPRIPQSTISITSADTTTLLSQTSQPSPPRATTPNPLGFSEFMCCHCHYTFNESLHFPSKKIWAKR